jgi:hypothetical protein
MGGQVDFSVLSVGLVQQSRSSHLLTSMIISNKNKNVSVNKNNS